jgi:tetratricopeptide (TPR) repeat protein
MKPAHRIVFMLAAMVMVICFASAPAIAQQEEADALNRRANELYQAGKFSEAMPLAQRSLAILEKALGADHPAVAVPLNDLASLHLAQGRYADAEPLFRRALAIREKALGPDHPNVAQLLNDLAELYRLQAHAMLTYMNDKGSPLNAYPAFWALFSIIGEGAAR